MPSTARWRIHLAVGLALATAGIGCTTLQLGNSASARRADADADDGDEAAPRIVSRAKKKVSSAPASNASVADADTKTPPRMRRPKGSSFAQHDPATRALIDRELADATPDEREDLMKRFRYLPAPSVRHILSERRKGLNVAGRQQDAAPSQQPMIAAATQSAAVVPAKAESAPHEAPRPARRRNSLNGLGTVSAWGHSAPPAREAAAPSGDLEAVADRPATIQSAAESDRATEPASDEDSPAGEARPVAFGQVHAEQNAIAGRSSGYRSDAAAPEPDLASAPSPAKPAAPATPAKGNPILGYLLPGRFGAAAAAAKPAAKPTAKPAATPANNTVATASVAVGVPRETPLEPEFPAGDPLAAGQSTPRELVEALIAMTEPEVARLTPGEDESEKQSYIEQHVYLRMLYLIAGQQERALQAIPGIDPADQEFWQQTFWGLTNYFDVNSMPSSADRAAETVSQLTKAVLRLQEKAHLDLKNVSFCHKIISFGNYEKYPRDEFRPGQEVLLYAEVANIHSEPAADGRFRTSLKSTLEIYRYGAEGELVEQIDLPETIDVCRTHRRDYFHSYQFTIPPRLTLGPHVLKLTVEDQLSRRSTSYSLNFMVK